LKGINLLKDWVHSNKRGEDRPTPNKVQKTGIICNHSKLLVMKELVMLRSTLLKIILKQLMVEERTFLVISGNQRQGLLI
jgi:hypothetical protein